MASDITFAVVTCTITVATTFDTTFTTTTAMMMFKIDFTITNVNTKFRTARQKMLRTAVPQTVPMPLLCLRNEHHKRRTTSDQKSHFQTNQVHDISSDNPRNRHYDQLPVHNSSADGNKHNSDSIRLRRCFLTNVSQCRQRQHLQTNSLRQNSPTNEAVQYIQTNIQRSLRTITHVPNSLSRFRILLVRRLRSQQHISTECGIDK